MKVIGDIKKASDEIFIKATEFVAEVVNGVVSIQRAKDKQAVLDYLKEWWSKGEFDTFELKDKIDEIYKEV